MKNTGKRGLPFLLCIIMTIGIFSSVYTDVSASGCILKISGVSSLTGNQAIDIVNIAEANLSKTGSKLGATEHWCADFVCCCARKANIGTDIIPDESRVSTLHNKLLELGAKEVKTPQAGDLVFYGTSHVAIMADSLYAYNGNFSGKGSGAAFWTSSKVVYCKYTSATNYKQYGAVFVRPKYKVAEKILTVIYKAGGGDISSDKYFLSSDVVWKKNGTKYEELWQYDKTKKNGLTNKGSFGIYKNGYHFLGWLNPSSVLLDEDNKELKPSQIEPEIKKGSCSVTLTASWEANKLNVCYNANGGVSDSTKYCIEEKTGDILTVKNQTRTSQAWTYNEPKSSGLYDDSKFSLKKDGYNFVGWSREKDSGEIFDQNDSDLLPTELCPEIEKGNATVMLYACWQQNHTHTEKIDKAVEPTCISDGLTKGSHCSECGAVIKEQKKVPALGHSFSEEETVDIEPTCASDGQSSRHCVRCEEVTDLKVIPKTAHKYSAKKTVKPTCTEKGYTIKVCTECGYEYKTNQKASTGHSYCEVVTKKATRKNSGTLSTKCSVCGKVKKTSAIPAAESVTVSAKNYTYNGKVRNPKITVKDSKGNTLSNKTDYSVRYSDSNSKLPGKYTVTVTFKGKYSGSTSFTYRIKPAAVKITKGSSKTRNTVKISYSEAVGATGYEVYYSSYESGNYHLLGTAKKLSYTSNSRTSGKTYYFKVRAYKTSSGEQIYGSFSKAYKVKSK